MPATSRATVVLPVPGLPSKIRCRVIVGRLEAGVPAQPLDPEHGRLPVDLGLDVGQPDERVELGEQLLDRLRRRLGLLRLLRLGGLSGAAGAVACGG